MSRSLQLLSEINRKLQLNITSTPDTKNRKLAYMQISSYNSNCWGKVGANPECWGGTIQIRKSHCTLFVAEPNFESRLFKIKLSFLIQFFPGVVRRFHFYTNFRRNVCGNQTLDLLQPFPRNPYDIRRFNVIGCHDWKFRQGVSIRQVNLKKWMTFPANKAWLICTAFITTSPSLFNSNLKGKFCNSGDSQPSVQFILTLCMS
mgnify:CR=1 FL=1